MLVDPNDSVGDPLFSRIKSASAAVVTANWSVGVLVGEVLESLLVELGDDGKRGGGKTHGVVNIGNAGDVLVVDALRAVVSGTSSIVALPLYEILGRQRGFPSCTDSRTARLTGLCGGLGPRFLFHCDASGDDSLLGEETAIAPALVTRRGRGRRRGLGREQFRTTDAVETSVTISH